MSTHTSGISHLHQVLFGGIGGHAAVAFTLVDALPDVDHSITFYGVEPPHHQIIGGGEVRDVDFASVTKTHGLDFGALNKVFRRAAEVDADAILLHSVTAVPAGWLWQRVFKRPTIVVDHTAPDAKSYSEWLSVYLGLILSSGFVFLTPHNRDTILSRFHPSTALVPIFVIPNGINVETFAPPEVKVKSENLTITMMARFCRERDFAGLVEAASRVVEREPLLRSKLRVVLAGDGPTWNSVFELVRRLDLGDVVELPGFIGESDVVSLLHQTDVYVQWSLADTISTSVMQAMACGVPVVASDIHGMDFLVQHGKSEFLAAPGDNEELAERLICLLADPDLRERLGQAALEKIRAHFSTQSMARNYRTTLNQLIRKYETVP